MGVIDYSRLSQDFALNGTGVECCMGARKVCRFLLYVTHAVKMRLSCGHGQNWVRYDYN